MGDLLGVGETEHEEDKESSSPAGGAVTSQGRGGDVLARITGAGRAGTLGLIKTES